MTSQVNTNGDWRRGNEKSISSTTGAPTTQGYKAKFTDDETRSNQKTSASESKSASELIQKLRLMQEELRTQQKTLETYQSNGVSSTEITSFTMAAAIRNNKMIADILAEYGAQTSTPHVDMLQKLINQRDDEIATLKSNLQGINKQLIDTKRDLDSLTKLSAQRTKTEYALKASNAKLQTKVKLLEDLIKSVEQEEEIPNEDIPMQQGLAGELPTPDLKPRVDVSFIAQLEEKPALNSVERHVNSPEKTGAFNEPFLKEVNDILTTTQKTATTSDPNTTNDELTCEVNAKEKTTPPSENISIEESATVVPTVQAELIKSVSAKELFSELQANNDEVYSISSTQDSQKEQIGASLEHKSTFATMNGPSSKGRASKKGKLKSSVKVSPIEEETIIARVDTDTASVTTSMTDETKTSSILAKEVSNFQAGLLGCGVKLLFVLLHIFVSVWFTQFIAIFVATVLMLGKTAMFLLPELGALPTNYKAQSVLRRTLGSGIKYAFYFFGVYVACRFFKKDVSLSSLVFVLVSEVVSVVIHNLPSKIDAELKTIKIVSTVVLVLIANSILYQSNILELFAKQPWYKLILTNGIGAITFMSIPFRKDMSQLNGIKNMIGFGLLVTWFYHFY